MSRTVPAKTNAPVDYVERSRRVHLSASISFRSSSSKRYLPSLTSLLALMMRDGANSRAIAREV